MKGAGVSEVPAETWSKMVILSDLVKSTQAAYEDVAELTARMESQLNAIRSEYESLMFSFKKKEEE